MMTSEKFQSTTLSAGEDPWIEAMTDGSYEASSFYQDSSGRSKVDMPLRLAFPSRKDLDDFLATKCLHPAPNVAKGEVPPWEERNGEDSGDEGRFSFGVEAKVTMTSGSGEAVSALVESVTITSSKTENEVLCLETQIVLRVARLEDDGDLDNSSLSGVRINLEVTAVLSEKSEMEDQDMAASVGLRALYLGRYADMGKTSARRVVHTRLTPLILKGTRQCQRTKHFSTSKHTAFLTCPS